MKIIRPKNFDLYKFITEGSEDPDFLKLFKGKIYVYYIPEVDQLVLEEYVWITSIAFAYFHNYRKKFKAVYVGAL